MSNLVSRLEPAVPNDRAWRWAKFCAGLLGAIAFANVPLNGYCYDDRLIVETSGRVQGSSPWVEIWRTDYWSEARPDSPQRDLLYRPVSVSTFRLVRAVCGPAPWAQHGVNVVLHMLICAGVVALGRSLRLSLSACVVAGAYFAVLPIHTDVVANAVGRCDLLAAAGIVAAILLHRRARGATGFGACAGWGAATGLAAFLAMGAKESAVTIVALIPMLDGFWREPGHDSLECSKKTTRRILLFTPLIVAAAAYLALRFSALGGRFVQEAPISRSVNVLVDAGAWQQALGVVQLWGMYWAKTFWPSVLSIGYSIRTLHLAVSPANAYVLIGLAAAGVLAWIGLRAARRGDRTPLLLFAGLIVAYLPTANALVLLRVFFAERIWYGPSIWVALLIGWGIARFLQHRIVPLAGILLLLTMTVRCWVRNAEWRDEGRLLAAAVRDQADGVAVLQLYGQYLVDRREFAVAAGVLERALRIDLGYTDAYLSLAEAQLGLGRSEEAMGTLAAAEQQFPGYARTQRLIAQAQAGLAHVAEAELTGLEMQARARPGDVEAELAVVRELRRWNRVREALDRLRNRQAEFEASTSWRYELAVTWVLLGERDEAIVAYQQLLEIERDHVQARVELVMLCLERRASGDLELADATLRPAELAAPNSPQVLVARGEWFAAQGRVHDAIDAYRRALERLPRGNPQRSLFEERMKSLGG